MREALDLAEEEGRALARLEAREGLLDREPQRVVHRTGGRGARRRGYRSFRAAAALPQEVVAGVQENPVEPGRDARASPETRRTPVDLQHRLLDRVLGVGAIAQDVRRDRFHL